MPFRLASTEWQPPDASAEVPHATRDGTEPAGHVSFHSVGARGVLFDSATQKLYLLNRLGGFIWCCLADGMSPDAVVHELVRRSNGDSTVAEKSVRAAIREWQMHGLMQGAHTEASLRKDVEPTLRRTHSRTPALEGRPADARTRVCRVLGCDFAVHFWDRLLETECLPLLQAHLVDMSQGITAALDVARGEGGAMAISHGSETMQVLQTVQSPAPAVFASLMKLALHYSPSYPALHAAMVRRAGGVVLFPGPSGCGKSTLMAGLLAAGHRVIGDDTAVLEPKTMRARALTPYLCIKAGSWDVLAGSLPQIVQQPDYIRADGAHVRYLLAPGYPTAAHADSETGEDVRAIVFPHYRAGAPTRLTRIAGFLALKELLPSIDPLGHSFTADDIGSLIGWLAATECYTLSYGTLHDVDAALSGALG